jgi:tRNA-uridine 2-sulfurtransferase
MKKKCIVMLSGGLDSLLAVKIMQEQDFEVTAVFFQLPFAGCCDIKRSTNFAQFQKINLKVFDCTKGKLLQEYLEVIKEAKYGRGAGINPCIDCKIFMMKKTKEFANKEKISLVVTGEVLGERPMSQMKKSMDIVKKESGLKNNLLRPLSAKLLPETDAEKQGLVNREKLYDIQGRRREKQIALANKFKISYPSPAGGCLLCEKAMKNKFKVLLERGINDDEIKLMNVGRHFMVDKCWIVLGRDENENKLIETIGKKYELIEPDYPAPSAIIFDKCKEDIREKVNHLIEVYSKKGSLKDRESFDSYRL